MGPIRAFICAVVAVGSLAGCAAGLHDETTRERSTPYVGAATVGGLKIRDVAVIASASTSTPATTPGSDTGETQGSLTMVIVNGGTAPDSITGVQVGDGGSVTPSDPSTSGTVEPGQSLIFGSGTDLSVSGLAAPLVVGTTVQVTVSFQSAGDVVLQAPVLSAPNS